MDCMLQPNLLTVREALESLRAGALSADALFEACLRQIERLNPQLNAFITVCDVTPRNTEGAPRQSQTQNEIATPASLRPLTSESRPAVTLNGIPIAVKDLFETRGIRTTAGSLFFKDYIPGQDAAVLKKLKAAGALVLGKTNTHEIALGVTTDNPHFGTCRNPWDTARIPGGSSGGSAVAVATGMAPAALGTDTGGSIRIPASLCGVVGLKPTYGRVSLRGVIPLSWNLDHAGPLTRSVADAALMLQVMAGFDPDDPFCVDQPVEDYSAGLEAGIRGWRVALATGEYIEDTDPEVAGAVRSAAAVCEALGAQVDSVDMTFLREAALANGLMTPADGAAYHRERLKEHPEWFGQDVRRRLEMGRDVSSGDYSLARKTQAVMKHRLGRFFEEFDALLLPSTPIAAPLIEGGDAVEQARRLTRFTAPFNLTGLPALSVPCGFNRDGLPLGLQVASGAWQEAKVLRLAFAYERATDWNRRRPLIS
jgi:aspartyl-tRNA(Asn)/glutamyl-tRNA(Gln) amidotransferase subunit A